MRFTRAHRYPFTWSPRKAAAVLVRQRKDRERLPLFADAIAAEQPEVDQVRAARAAAWGAREIERRQHEADKWREVRRRIASLAEHDRRLFLDLWNYGPGGRARGVRAWCPGNAGYCATVLHMVERGDYAEHDGRLISRSELAWRQGLEVKLAAMSDQELEQTIQSHINMVLVELGRLERRRRLERSLELEPARRVTRPTRRAIGGRR